LRDHKGTYLKRVYLVAATPRAGSMGIKISRISIRQDLSALVGGVNLRIQEDLEGVKTEI